MRGKRSKQYRKLMQQYALAFGFREPYQVLVDAQMLQDALRFKMDLPTALSRTLHGQVKIMITHCSIGHLFALPTAPHGSQPSPSASTSQDLISPDTKTALLSLSRTLELRKCNHHTLPEPLSALECLSSVIDPKGSGTNKHRLIIACQDESVRIWARNNVRGVPSVYVKRSVMIMEPMAEGSRREAEGQERGKLRAGVRRGGPVRGGGGTAAATKRKRDGEVDGGDEEPSANGLPTGKNVDEPPKKRKKKRGPKGPNPLSVKKKKPKPPPQSQSQKASTGDNAVTVVVGQ